MSQVFCKNCGHTPEDHQRAIAWTGERIFTQCDTCSACFPESLSPPKASQLQRELEMTRHTLERWRRLEEKHRQEIDEAQQNIRFLEGEILRLEHACPDCGEPLLYVKTDLFPDEADPRRKEDGTPLLAPFKVGQCKNGHEHKKRVYIFD